MADHFYGVNVGDSLGAVVKGTATGATNVELRITDAVTGMSKVEALRLIEVIESYIETDNAPA